MKDTPQGFEKPTDLEDRTVRALTECMTVLPEGGDVYSVSTESGSEYRVDSQVGRCNCPDQQHNLDPDESCKHVRRVEFATGDREIPQWVNTDAVDPQLGNHVEGPSVVTDTVTNTTEAIADGGTTITPSEGNTDERGDSGTASKDDECDCDDLPDGCPCFQCYLGGAEFTK